MKTQILRRFTSAVLAAALCFSSLSTPVYAQETAAADSFSGPVQELPADTEEPSAEASDPKPDAGQAFVDAMNALDRDAIIAASNSWGLASQAWQADPENEELAAALDEAIAAQDAATQPFAGLAKAGRYRCQCG